MNHYLGVCKLAKESCIVDVRSNGELQYVFFEERFNRKKYYDNFPINAIFKMLINRTDSFRMGEFNKGDIYFIDKFFSNISFINTQNPLHHLCHAYESFYTSGFDRAAILVVDGFGQNNFYGIDSKESITLYQKEGRKIKELKKYFLPDSLGLFYGRASSILGFNDNEEGHFMGLAAYGKPFEKRILSIQNGQFKYDTNMKELEKKYTVNKNSLDLINSINFAATVQRDLSECVLELVKDIKNITNEENLCLSGGVFNNVVINNAICESGIFKNIWCSPTPGDFGIAIGKAYLTYETDVENLEFHKLDSAYKGDDIDSNDENILKYFKENNISYSEISSDSIVRKLSKGRVLAWFQGASEFGRRALGHRSIIADPSKHEMYKLISGEIKKRAPYRPLACTVPDELFDLIFDVKNKDLTEYMLRAIPIRKEMIDKIPACTHIDYTTRPQRLRKEVNPEFHKIIMDFYNVTGIPCVINTSLNGGGEPIVETISDLMRFLNEHINVSGAIINAKYYIDNTKLYENKLKWFNY